MLIKFTGLHLIYVHRLTSELSLLSLRELFVQACLLYNANRWAAYRIRRSAVISKHSL